MCDGLSLPCKGLIPLSRNYYPDLTFVASVVRCVVVAESISGGRAPGAIGIGVIPILTRQVFPRGKHQAEYC